MLSRLVHGAVLAFALVLAGGAVHAAVIDDPDTEVAKRHFNQGRTFYDAQDYRHALAEFLDAKRATAAPGLDYNIARCYDRLEEYPKAIEHYQLYVAARPNAPDAPEVRQRIAALETRIRGDANGTPAPSLPLGPEKLMPPPSFDEAPPARAPEAVLIASAPPTENRHRRNLAIAVGVAAGVVVVGTAIALGIVFGRSSSPAATRSDFGPWTITR